MDSSELTNEVLTKTCVSFTLSSFFLLSLLSNPRASPFNSNAISELGTDAVWMALIQTMVAGTSTYLEEERDIWRERREEDLKLASRRGGRIKKEELYCYVFVVGSRRRTSCRYTMAFGTLFSVRDEKERRRETRRAFKACSKLVRCLSLSHAKNVVKRHFTDPRK